jgi:hypothetical protein
MEAYPLRELLLQSLEHERGGLKIYQAALQCALNEVLKEEWEEYLEQTQNHVRVLTEVCTTLQLDPQEQPPGSNILHEMGGALVAAIEEARPGAAAQNLKAGDARALKDAYEEVKDQEDEHLYLTRGWCRELWLQSLGMQAVLPPPEERRHVKTAVGAARAEQTRTKV